MLGAELVNTYGTSFYSPGVIRVIANREREGVTGRDNGPVPDSEFYLEKEFLA